MPAAIGLAVAALALMATVIWLKERTEIYGVRGLEKHPRALEGDARRILESIGFESPIADSSYYYLAHSVDEARAAEVAGGFDPATILPAPVSFAYRQSPAPLVPLEGNEGDRRIIPYDPPFTEPGMARVLLSPEGVLRHILIVPDDSYLAGSASERAVEWDQLFELSNLDWSTATEQEPSMRSPVQTDERHTWKASAGTGQPEVVVEGGALRGRLVWYAILVPWESDNFWSAVSTPQEGSAGRDAFVVIQILVLIGSLWVARKNWLRGRADRAGALKVLLFIAVVLSAGAILRADFPGSVRHTWRIGMDLVGRSLLNGIMGAALYLAIEPYVRRNWPALLVSWSRLLRGRFDDPLIGKTILSGLVAASLIPLPGLVRDQMRGLVTTGGFQSALTSVEQAIAVTIEMFSGGINAGLVFTALLVGAAAVLRNRAVAAVLVFVVFAALAYSRGQSPLALIVAGILTFVVYRFGLLGASVAIGATQLMILPLTLDTRAVYFPSAVPPLLLLLALIGWGVYTSTSGTTSAFESRLSDSDRGTGSVPTPT